MAVANGFSLIAAACGGLCGIIGFLPLLFATKKVNLSMKIGSTGFGIVCIGISFLLMVIALIVCRIAAPSAVFSFGIGELALFLLVTLVYALWYAKRIKKEIEP